MGPCPPELWAAWRVEQFGADAVFGSGPMPLARLVAMTASANMYAIYHDALGDQLRDPRGRLVRLMGALQDGKITQEQFDAVYDLMQRGKV